MIPTSTSGSSKTCYAATMSCGSRPKTHSSRPKTHSNGPEDGHSVSADELQRVLDQTAADYEQLKEQHAELAETLALLRRYIFGQRRERFVDAPGQGYFFDIPEITIESEPVKRPISPAAAKPSTATRSPRRTRLDHLPHIRIPHDVPEAEKTCSCCGGPKTRIGEDESRELDFIPARLEVKVHVLPKYACPKCRDGVVSPPVPPEAWSRAGSPGRDWSRT